LKLENCEAESGNGLILGKMAITENASLQKQEFFYNRAVIQGEPWNIPQYYRKGMIVYTAIFYRLHTFKSSRILMHFQTAA